MMRKLYIACTVLVAAAALVFYLVTMPVTLPAADLPDHTADIANGAYMFHAGGCASCHAAPGAKGAAKERLAGGLALKSPFGTFYAPNISPDARDGIGGWSERDFINAMMYGVSPDGRHYYPAFPYTFYRHMRLADVRDIKAYLDTLPAVKSVAREHDLTFPFTIRRLLGGWKFLFMGAAPESFVDTGDERLRRGAYLVNGPGHCGACHSPRNMFGAIIGARAYSGAPNPEGEGVVPNITPHPSGIGAWSVDDIAESLKSGFTPEFDTFGGSMVAVQENMAKLSDADRLAIATYLKALPPRPRWRPD